MQDINMTFMTENLISVIVPVYKVEAYLDRCVQSIVDQSYRNLEIILVDDGSPDKCPEMCDAWADKDPRIRVIHKDNGGLSDARNAGMTAATGEYISFVDSDDWIAPEMLEKLFEAMERDDSDIAACTVKMVWEDESPSMLLTVKENRILNPLEAEKALLEETFLKQPVWYKLYRRNVAEGLLFPLGKYHEDVFWSYLAVGRACRVSVIDYIGYFYFQRRGSIMGEGYSLKRLDAIKAKTEQVEYYSKCHSELENLAKIKLCYACIYHGQMALKHLPKEEREKAISFLQITLRKNTVPLQARRGMRFSHRIWIFLAFFSLSMTCRIRNELGIGL